MAPLGRRMMYSCRPNTPPEVVAARQMVEKQAQEQSRAGRKGPFRLFALSCCRATDLYESRDCAPGGLFVCSCCRATDLSESLPSVARTSAEEEDPSSFSASPHSSSARGVVISCHRKEAKALQGRACHEKEGAFLKRDCACLNSTTGGWSSSPSRTVSQARAAAAPTTWRTSASASARRAGVAPGKISYYSTSSASSR